MYSTLQWISILWFTGNKQKYGAIELNSELIFVIEIAVRGLVVISCIY